MRPTSPQPDDGPEPYRTTPKRFSHQVETWAVQIAELAIRGRKLGILIKDPRVDEAVNTMMRLTRDLSDLAAGIMVGRVEIVPEFTDSRHQPERPLLDHIESAPVRRAAEAIAPAVALRGNSDPAWRDEPVTSPSPAHPAAEPARAAARRRKASSASSSNGKAQEGGDH